MPEGVKVASVACGDSHSAAVTSDGKLYTWGWGGSLWSGSGLLGHGDGASHTTPKLVESLLEEEGLEVKTAALGELHSAILTTDGERSEPAAQPNINPNQSPNRNQNQSPNPPQPTPTHPNLT